MCLCVCKRPLHKHTWMKRRARGKRVNASDFRAQQRCNYVNYQWKIWELPELCATACRCRRVCGGGNASVQPPLALIIRLKAAGAKFTHLMAEVLLPTGLTGKGLITGKRAWLLTRAPFWITPRGTERESRWIISYTQDTNQFQCRAEGFKKKNTNRRSS